MESHLTLDKVSLTLDMEKLIAFAQAYREDPDVRSLAASDPHAVLAQNDFESPPDMDVKIVENTEQLFHVVFPPDPNTILADEDLLMVAGGKSASSAGSAGTASTISSVATTVGSAASASTAGSAGSAG